MESSPFNAPERKFTSPQEELEYLRAQIAQKEEALQSAGHSPERTAVVKEHVESYREAPSEEVLAEGHAMTPEEVEASANEILAHGDHPQMSELLGIVNEKGLRNAISVVLKLQNAHVEDDFHQMVVQYIKNGMVVDGIKEKSQLYRALHMTLFEVILPSGGVDEESRKKTLKELVSAMEQFYAGMLAVSSSGRIRV